MLDYGLILVLRAISISNLLVSLDVLLDGLALALPQMLLVGLLSRWIDLCLANLIVFKVAATAKYAALRVLLLDRLLSLLLHTRILREIELLAYSLGGLKAVFLKACDQNVAMLLQQILKLIERKVAFIVGFPIILSCLLVLLPELVQLLVQKPLILEDRHSFLEVLEEFIHHFDLSIDESHLLVKLDVLLVAVDSQRDVVLLEDLGVFGIHQRKVDDLLQLHLLELVLPDLLEHLDELLPALIVHLHHEHVNELIVEAAWQHHLVVADRLAILTVLIDHLNDLLVV